MDFFEEAALAQIQRPSFVRPAEAPYSPVPLVLQQDAAHAPATMVFVPETDPLSGLFGSLPILAADPGPAPQGIPVADKVVADASASDVPDGMPDAAAVPAPVSPTESSEAPPQDGGSAGGPRAAILPAVALVADAVAVSQGADADGETSASLRVPAAAMPPEAVTGGAASDDAAANVQPTGLGYTACWRAFLGLHRSMKHAIVTCNVVTKDVFGTSFVLGEAGSLNEVRNGIVTELVSKATEVFRYRGVSLDIPIDKVREALGTKGNFHPDWPEGRSYYYMSPMERQHERQRRDQLDLRLSEEFDPDAVWAYLEAQFSGAPGDRLALQKVARLIFQHLGLERRVPVEDKGRLLITTSAWNDALQIGRVYSESSRQNLRTARLYLAEFAKWAADDDCANALEHQHVPVLDDSKCAIVSRSKVRIGGTEWTFFNERIEIRFTPELGLKFRQFVAEFGPRPNADH
jgi:hypothetical protein